MLIDYLSDRRSVVDNTRFYVRDRSVVLVLLEKRYGWQVLTNISSKAEYKWSNFQFRFEGISKLVRCSFPSH